MNINKENRICSNPMNAPMHEKKRFQTAPIPRTESIYKLNKIKDIGIFKPIDEKEVFNFNNTEAKKKVIKKQKPNKLLDNKTDNKKTKIKLQYT